MRDDPHDGAAPPRAPTAASPGSGGTTPGAPAPGGATPGAPEAGAPPVTSPLPGTPAPERLRLRVDGRRFEVGVAHGAVSLLDVLRTPCGSTAAKDGCEEGRCGACTVLLDGVPVASCVALALDADGRSVVTSAGLAAGGATHPAHDALVEHGAVQCGFCTPGVAVTIAALATGALPRGTSPADALAGHLCRCTGYGRILAAAEAVLARGATPAPSPAPDGSRPAG